MKPLILLTLILQVSVCLQAQTIADAARKERARRAQLKSIIVITSDDVRGTGVATTGAAAGADASAAKPVENSAPAAPAVDPVQKWSEDSAKLRTRVRDLTDQATATQLEINNATAQINAPVTSQSAKTQAQNNLAAAQKKLATIKTDLEKAQAELQEMNLQGPPKK